MKLIITLLLFFPSVCMGQWAAVKVSSANNSQAIQENFRRAAIYSNRKLDRFSNDTLYGQPIFKNGVKFGDGTIQNTAIPSTAAFVLRTGDTMSGQLTVQSSITAAGLIQTSGLVLNSVPFPVTLKSSATATEATTIVFPPNKGSPDYMLFTDGNGNTSWKPQLAELSAEYYLSPYPSDISPYLLMLSSPTVGLSASTRTFTVDGTIIISTYITPIGFPNALSIPEGTWQTHIWGANTSPPGSKNLFVKADVYKRTSGGVETLLFSFPGVQFVSAVPTQYEMYSAQTAFSLDTTDRIFIKYSAYNSGIGTIPTLEAYRDNNYYSDLDIPQVAANVGTYVPYSGATADVDLGSHKLTVSSNVYIVGFSSAAKYYGDGSSLTGLSGAALASTQTFTGSNTFTATTTLPTRDKIVFGNEIANSSSTVKQITSATTQSAFTVCQSTLTITTNGGRIEAISTGYWYGSAVTSSLYATLFLDGVNQGNIVNNTITEEDTVPASTVRPLNAQTLTAVLSAGVHSVCISFKVSGGGTLTAIYQSWIKELR